jgi:chaperonin cofactor prefoldin
MAKKGSRIMTDDELRELVHRVELRLERLDARFEGIDKRMAALEGRFDGLERRLTSLETQLNTRLEGLEARLHSKAGNWVFSLWGATLAVLIALLTLWK